MRSFCALSAKNAEHQSMSMKVSGYRSEGGKSGRRRQPTDLRIDGVDFGSTVTDCKWPLNLGLGIIGYR